MWWIVLALVVLLAGPAGASNVIYTDGAEAGSGGWTNFNSISTDIVTIPVSSGTHSYRYRSCPQLGLGNGCDNGGLTKFFAGVGRLWVYFRWWPEQAFARGDGNHFFRIGGGASYLVRQIDTEATGSCGGGQAPTFTNGFKPYGVWGITRTFLDPIHGCPTTSLYPAVVGQWNTVTVDFKLNANGSSDGHLFETMNGTTRVNETGMAWRNNNDQITHFAWHTNFDAAPVTWYLDDLVICDGPPVAGDGCSAALALVMQTTCP